MGLRTGFWWVVTLAGLAAGLGGTYTLLNGSFFGGPAMGTVTLMGSLLGFVLGLVAFTLGGSKLVRARAGL